MTFNLENKFALITGAASGIGLASAQLFATHGADLVLVDISPKITEISNDLKAKHPKRNISSHFFDVSGFDILKIKMILMIFKKA